MGRRSRGVALLPADEPENSAAMEELLQRDGIAVRTGVPAASVSSRGHAIGVALSDGSALCAERLLVATGRRSDLRSLGMAAAGLETRPRGSARTSGCGPARGPGRRRRHRALGQFTYVANYQAQIAAADILGTDHEPADYAAVPRVTFADPEVGSVGEAEARRRGLTFRVGVLPTSASDRAWLYGPGADLGVLELVEDVRTGTLLGGSSFGPAAGETAALLALALRARSPVAVLNEVICPYPTFARAIRGALCRLA